MAALTLAEVKNYIRVDNNTDDSLITSLMSSANIYLTGQVSKTKRTTGENTSVVLAEDDLFKQAQLLLVSHWYDNRDVESSKVSAPVRYTVDAIITHIEGCSDYE